MKSLWEKQKKRTHLCGEITSNLKDKQVVLNGRVKSLRDHGNLLFADIVDDSGMVQVTFDHQRLPNGSIQNNSIMTVLYLFRDKSKNGLKICKQKDVKTGEWEIIPQEMDILAFAKNSSFPSRRHSE